jgi:thymidylate synthase
MHTFQGPSIDHAYPRLCRQLSEYPEFTVSPRGFKTQELLNVGIVLSHPRRRLLLNKIRNISKRYLAGETAFYFAGSDSLAFISHYAKFWETISDDGTTVNSCYGKRLFVDRNTLDETQFDYAAMKLVHDQDTRKAIVMISGPNDANPSTKDNPCTICIQFLIRDGRLYATTFMRSNDIWLGLPYDVFFFTLLQDRMLFLVNKERATRNQSVLELGYYTHIVGSMHVYEKHTEKIADIAETLKDGTWRVDDTEELAWDYDTEQELPRFLAYEKALRLGESHDYSRQFKSVLWDSLRTWLKGGSDD